VEEMADYYARRASEHDEVYEKPERQKDLAVLREYLGQAFANRDVLEVACGTGYWTRYLCRSARSVLALDINEEVLEIARRRTYVGCPVRIVQADAYDLSRQEPAADAALLAFWWSHLPLQRLDPFLSSLKFALRPRADVLVLDNRFVAGSSTEFSRRDAWGNTYQLRRLKDGNAYEVLKNFPDRRAFMRQIRSHGECIEFRELDYYWYAWVRLHDSDEG
jgi:ubiquinone/menaquinone biosynthesis C-methylase UbiE